MQNVQHSTQSQLMVNGLYLAALSAAIFFSIDHPSYDTRIYGVGLLVFVALIAAVRWLRAPTVWVTHALLATAWVLVVWAMTFTGGVHSTKMIWLSMLMPAAYLVLPARQATAWAVWLAVTVLIMAGLNLTGVIAPPAMPTVQGETVLWSWLNRVQVIIMMLVCVHLYQFQHKRATQKNETYNQELEATSRTLQQVQAHKDAFLAAVGHELRTPMNAILGLNGVLRTQLTQDPQACEVVDLIRRSTEQLLLVVNNILDFSRLQAHRLQLVPEPLALETLLQSCEQAFVVLAQSKGLQLRLYADDARGVWVQADAQRLQQIIHNLLDNAIKFSDHGEVTLRAQRAPTGWRFEVQDTGIGIAPQRQPYIFQRFEHADAQTNRLYGGTGLGLAICDQLVRLQHGQIGVRSQPGQGACFWFELPLQEVTPPVSIATVDFETLSAHAWRILVVDDNELNRVVATMMLNKQLPNASVAHSANATDALQRLAHEHFDVVLMDIIMPEMGGMLATRQLRAQDGPNTHTPVLAMTAINQPEDRVACLAAGMNAMIGKPLRAPELMQTLAAVLTHATKDKP